MARIRSIKPTIWGDSRFASLSRDARLLMIGLMSNADDEGRFIATTTSIAGAVYPHDQDVTAKQVRAWRDEIAGTGIIRIYRLAGREYGHFPNYGKHQRIDRPQRSTLPPPPELEFPGSFGDPFGDPFDDPSANGSRPDHGQLAEEEASASAGEWNGMEGKGELPPAPAAPVLGSDNDPDFTAFWAAYPLKKDKGHARGAWRTAVGKRHAKPALIIQAAERYRDDPTRKPDFTAYAATWLNGERYNDDSSGERRADIGPSWEN